jgi:hypothetical protein
MACQIIRAYRGGFILPSAENLQEISKKIKGGPELGCKLVMRAAAKHPATR